MALKFFWTCENASLTANDLSTDTSATASGATLDSAAGMVGTNGILIDADGEYFAFSHSGTDYFNPAVGSCGFLLRYTVMPPGSKPFSIRSDSSGAEQYSFQREAADEFRFSFGDPDASVVTASATSTGMSTSTIYGIVGRWDDTNNLLRVEIYSDPLGTPSLLDFAESTSAFTAPASLTGTDRFRIGDVGGLGFRGHIDNIMVCDAYDDPIEENFGITSYTEFGATGGSIVPHRMALLGVG